MFIDFHKDTSNFLITFYQRHQEMPDKKLYTFIDKNGTDQQSLSYLQTYRYMESIAGFLTQDCSLNPGDSVLLVYTPSLDFICAFLGCLWARLIPVPIAPPNPYNLEKDLIRFAELTKRCRAKAILTNREYLQAKKLSSLKNIFSGIHHLWSDLPWYTTDQVQQGQRQFSNFVPPSLDDVAFLQYTSGSTSLPRGVMITYRNLQHQFSIYTQELFMNINSRSVCWVPHYHDFGLISGILSAMSGNGHLYMMSPLTFIERPHIWFDVMSRVKATHTAAPNFGYEIAVRKTTPEQRSHWDLRSLQVVMNAAEPIRYDTVQAFLETFAVCGLPPQAFCPAYGLAEHTVGVSLWGKGVLRVSRSKLEQEGKLELAIDATVNSRLLMGCGKPSAGIQMKIIHPESHVVLPDGMIGEIWVHSPSKAAGYFDMPEDTRATFSAYISGELQSQEYLCTGDLGFVHEDEIYITGRLKDMIIINGHNFYSEDIEETVRACHNLIRPGGVVVFSIETQENKEDIVVVVESREKKSPQKQLLEMVGTIRRKVYEIHQLPCSTIVVGKRGSVLKTSSGKVARRANRQSFLEGKMQTALVVHSASPQECKEKITYTAHGNHISKEICAKTLMQKHSQSKKVGVIGALSQSWQRALDGFRSIFFPTQESHKLEQVVVAKSDEIVSKHQNNDALLLPEEAKKNTAQKVNKNFANVTDEMLENHIKQIVVESISASLKIERAKVDKKRSFSEYDIDSILAVELVNTINERCNITLQTATLFYYSCVDELTKYIIKEHRSVFTSSLQKNTSFVAREMNVELTIPENYPFQNVSEIHSFQVPESTKQTTKIAKSEMTKSMVVEKKEQTSQMPLTEGQKGLWMIQKLSPEMSAYNLPLAFSIKQGLNIQSFEKAWAWMLQQYPILCTMIKEKEGVPYQYIHPEQKITVACENMENLNEQQFLTYMQTKIKEPFSFATDALIRVHIFSRSQDEYVVLLTFHHIIFDGTSMLVFTKALWKAYDIYLQNREPEVIPSKTTYSDFVVWEQEMLNGEKGAKSLAYWKKKLAGELPVLQLPMDRQRQGEQSFYGKTYATMVPLELAPKIRGLAKSQKVNLSIFFLAAFKTLLYRYTNEPDIVVGIPALGRPQRRFAEIIGYCINMLVMRSDMTQAKTFGALLTQIQLTVIEGLDHGYPLPKLVKELKIKRERKISPLFQVSFAYQNFVSKTALQDFAHNNIELLDDLHQEGEYDLVLEILEEKDSFHLFLKYNADLFHLATIERMMAHYVNLIARICENPEMAIADYDFLAEWEKQKILVEYNDTEVEYAQNKTIHALFEEQVEKTPDNVAVRTENQQLSYRELNERANQVAWQLRKKGVAPDQLVAIMMERSVEMVIGIFAILKSGAAYLPIDPHYPEQRIAYMLKDSDAEILLINDKHKAEYEKIKHFGGDIVDLAEIDTVAKQNGANLPPLSSAQNLAYVIYTSGSTGKPKGVMVEHHSVINRMQWMQKAYSLNAQDVVLQKTAITFDASVLELFCWSGVGASLCLLKPGGEKIPDDIVSAIENFKVSIIHFVPSMFSAFLQYVTNPKVKSVKSLKRILIGGEALTTSQVQTFQEIFAKETACQLIHRYGPTEATITVSSFDCTNMEKATVVPIGKPIDNISIDILDSHGMLCPIGVAGELCITGAGVARGYLHRQELTAQKFVKNPYRSGKRMYKTGDIARWLPDGNIEFIGRMDQQVKVRGFRIELGEIEAILLEHEIIKEVIVVVREDIVANKQLVAYVMIKEDKECTTSELRSWLQEQLPAYMIPAHFIKIIEWSLTSSGKINRKALLAPNDSLIAREEHATPRNEIEKTLIGIWQDILNVNNIGIHDNFFEVGGDSILSIQIIAKAKQQGLSFAPRDIFQHQTIAELSSVCKEENHIPVAQGLIHGMVTLTPIHKWFFTNNLLLPDYWNQSLLQVTPQTNIAFLKKSFYAILQHHDILRSYYFQDKDGDWKQQIVTELPEIEIVEMNLSDLSHNRQKEVIEQTCNGIRERLKLTTIRRIELHHLQRGNGQNDLLYIAIHHVIIDSFSWRILLEDLASAYQQLVRGENIQLLPKTTSFPDWAERLQSLAQSKEMIAELGFWQQALHSENRAFISVNADAIANFGEVQTIFMDWDIEQTKLLQNLPEAQDLLLTALMIALCEWTGKENVDWLVDIVGHGREDVFVDIDISRTIGWFTTIFPIMLCQRSNMALDDMLKAVKEKREQIPLRGIGYGILRYLCENNDVIDNLPKPKVEIGFNYLGKFAQTDKESFIQGFAEPIAKNSKKGGRGYLLDINAAIADGKLCIAFSSSKMISTEAPIEKLAHGYQEALNQIIQHCLAPETKKVKVPHLNSDPKQPDQLLAHYGDITAIYPLSPMQQGMLFHSILEPESGVYFEHLRFKLAQLHVKAFETAWNLLLETHSALRTSFAWEGIPEPRQLVHKNAIMDFHYADWQSLNPETQQQQLDELCKKEQEKGFDLTKCPLMKVMVLQLQPELYQIIWNRHHILSDGWSLPIMVEQLFNFYHMLVKNRSPILPKEVPYCRYIEWLEKQDKQSSQRFWKEYLAGLREPTYLPIQRDMGKSGSFNIHKKQTLVFSEEQTLATKNWVKKHRITLNTYFQGVWALVLHNYSQKDDIVFGITVSGRNIPIAGIEQCVGLFINTLPLRIPIDAHESVDNYLQRIQRINTKLWDHERDALVDIKGWSEMSGCESIFTHILVFENYPIAKNVYKLPIEDFEGEDKANYPLGIVILPGKTFQIEFRYDSHLYSDDSISRLISHVQNVALAMMNKSNPLVSQVDILNKEEEQQLGYWQQQLANIPTILDLPTDKPRPAIQTYNGDHIGFEIEPEITQKLQQLCNEEGVTMFMCVYAAFACLLARYSNQEDVVIGTPIANRNIEETEELIGFFVNTLALRVNLENNPTFLELLKEVRTTTLEAYNHQDVPFEYLVDKLAPERNMSHSPIFQVMLAWQNFAENDLVLDNLEMELVESPYKIAKFDMTLAVQESNGRLNGSLEYNTDLFLLETMQQFLAHFKNILSKIVEKPQQKLSTLEILSKQEQQKIVYEWNNTECDFPQDKCIHELFEEQVDKTPDAIAVVCGEEQFTYYELNQRANALANYLIGQGIKKEKAIGLCVMRSTLAIVSILGILKSGAHYVPLDISYPLERLKFILQDTESSILITDQSEKFISLENINIIDITKKLSSEEKRSCYNKVSPLNSSYIMYTSGSTGLPKGIVVTHHNVMRLVKNTNYITLSEKTIFLQCAPLAFDASTLEIWGALLNGGKLVILPNEFSLQNISKYVRYYGVNTLWLTAALFSEMVANELENLREVDHILAGGDILSTISVNKLINEKIPGNILTNGYGPTECTTFSCCYRFENRAYKSIPIGTPINNAQIYILDKNLQIVPIKVFGEIYIGGLGLARGYINRPGLTAERFVPNPFSKKDGERLYKTGDLARYLPDGNIEFIGRKDHQVKVRGFRIELGEIEANLLEHENVKETVVIVREDTTENKMIVAYIVVSDKENIGIEDLRSYLKNKLPEYMIPSAFVVLDKLPLTPNGKVDRKTLPKPDFAIEKAVKAKTPVEEIIVNVWQKLLALENVGVEDNFFHMGGHSLLATQLVSRLSKTLQKEISIRDVFLYPTIREIAAHLEKKNRTIEKFAIEKADRSQNLPLSFAQQRLWFLDKLEEASANYNMPGVLKLIGKLDIAKLEKALQYIVMRHEVLRTHFVEVENETVQVIHNDTFTIQVEENTNLEEIQSQIEIETHRPFDLSKDMLLRAIVYKVAEGEWILFVNMHHIISDGWSIGIFMRELATLYNALQQKDTCELDTVLSALKIQYADFALWQRLWLQGKVLEEQLGYWQQQLANIPTILDLPTDKPRPAIQTYNGDHIVFEIEPQIIQKLQQLCNEEGVTMFMCVYAAFACLLARYTNQEDIVIGTPIANRNIEETEELIGFFVNTLALRVNLENNPTFLELLKKVRTTTLEAYNHQDVPFEYLVDRLAPERNMSHSPIFQVMLAWQNFAENDLVSDNLEIEFVESPYRIAKFDMTLSVQENDGRLSGSLEYNTDLFLLETMQQFLAHFKNILSEIVEKPQQKISSLEILSKQEQQKIVNEWNDTECDFPQDKCIHELFEEQVEKTPDAIAVICGEEQLTYRELNERANQLAHYLVEQGVKEEVLVGIYLERSIRSVISLLAILKAGGSYVPIDIDYPYQRKKFIVENAKIYFLLREYSLKKHNEFKNIKEILIDNLNLQTNNHNLKKKKNLHACYVIYTSGSTGNPKGVMVSHRNLVNSTYARNNQYKKNKIFLLVSPFSFDISVAGIFSTLSTGNCLVISNTKDTFSILSLISKYQVDSILCVPSFYSLLLDQDYENTFLSNVIVGGEKSSSSLIKKHFSKWDKTKIYNEYGPTEATVWASAYEFLTPDQITIGKPIKNTQIYIINNNLQPVPVGVIGEIYIGGTGLARGYINRPGLTAERFVPNPFSKKAGERLYKTGDLARYLPDGNIEFIGRKDHQVKVRGFRIELGEIEANLLEHENVKETVVIVREDTAGNKMIVAYLIVPGENNLDIEDLRNYLKNKLPEYMIPSAFVILAELPITSNGKVDRKALPAPNNLMRDSEFTFPQSEVEKKLVHIWQDVLKLENISTTDNFFEIGGHSLSIITVQAKIKEKMSVELKVIDLFKFPTIKAIADYIECKPKKYENSPLHVSEERRKRRRNLRRK